MNKPTIAQSTSFARKITKMEKPKVHSYLQRVQLTDMVANKEYFYIPPKVNLSQYAIIRKYLDTLSLAIMTRKILECLNLVKWKILKKR